MSLPIIVLGVFAWLVSRHSVNLFSPGDFRDEKNYVEMVSSKTLSTVASLTVAAAKDNPESVSDAAIARIVESVQRSQIIQGDRYSNSAEGVITSYRKHALWVDDNPQNNIHERRAFEGFGVVFTLAESTTEALHYLSYAPSRDFAAIISDMGRREGPREGYVLLDTLRQKGDQNSIFLLCRFERSCT